MKRLPRLVALAALPLALACNEPPVTEADMDAAVLPVQTLTVEARDGYVVSEAYSGRVTPRRRSQLGFERGGRLERLRVDEGARVAAGERLARLDVRALQARRRELDAQIAEVEARLSLARLTSERQRTLHAGNHASQARLDAALAEEQALEARLEAAKAGLASVRVALALSRIDAPYAGTITARMADEGTVVAAGASIFELIEDGVLEARIGLPPATAAALDPEAAYEIEVAGASYPARLQAALPSVEPETRTVTAIFRLPEASGLADGALARVRIARTIEATGFWLPITALAESRRGLWSAYVVAPGEDGTAAAERRQLEVIHAESARAFVRGTLEDGERVVVAGAHRLVPGQRVRVVGAPALARR